MITTIKMIDYDEEGFEVEKELPAKWVICSHCQGEGVGYLGNRGFVMTQEDFDEDPDLYEELENGTYNQPCAHCDGTGKIKVPTTEEGKEIARLDAEFTAESYAERCFERGCSGDKEWWID